MWRTLREIGLYGDPYGGVDHEYVDASTRDLDPIDRTTAGRIDPNFILDKVKKTHSRLSFVLPALLLVTAEIFTSFSFTQLKEGPVPMDHTSKKWNKHVESLIAFSILEEIPYALVKSCSKYFGVPKGKEMARAIWNGKKFSKMFVPPPPVHLPYLPNLLREISRLVQTGGLISMITGDFRHFFHQIRVSSDMAHHFCIACEMDGTTKYFKWRTLPMGLSLSPWIAQSVGWAVLLYREIDQEELFEIPEGLTQLPTLIRVKGGGFITLYYDNLLVVGCDHEIMKRVNKRLLDNLKKFNVEVKPGSWVVRSSDDLRTKPITYLGSEILVTRSRNRTTGGWTRMATWRQAADKHKDALDVYKTYFKVPEKSHEGEGKKDEPLRIHTPRAIASFIGKILWRHQLSLIPLFKVRDLIGVLRKCATNAQRTKKGWDEEFQLSEDDVTVVQEHWKIVDVNKWENTEFFPVDATPIVLATDSSDKGWGYVIYDGDGNILLEQPFLWGDKEAEYHIYVKEALAGCRGVVACLEFFNRPLSIAVGIDNSAAAAAVRGLHSANVIVCGALDEMHSRLIATKSITQVCGVRSIDNSSDPVSRGTTLQAVATRSNKPDTDLGSRCFKIIMDQVNGITSNPHLPNYKVEDSADEMTIRHAQDLTFHGLLKDLDEDGEEKNV